MSRVIKGYQLSGSPQSVPQGPGAPAFPAVAPLHGRVPRDRVQVVGHSHGAVASATRPQGLGGAHVGSVVTVGALAPASAALPVPAEPAVQEQVDLLLARAQAKADLMLRQAEEKAELLIDQAVNGAQALIDEERRAAREEGYREGLAEGQREAAALRQQAEAVHTEALAERDQLFAESREQVVELALTVARQLVRQELGDDPELLLPLVDEALSRVHGEEAATLRVAPQAAAVFEAERESLASRHGLGELRVVGDASLEAGDLQVTTASGSVDAQLDRQLGTLRNDLSEVVRRG